jgi:acetate kinase
VHGGERFSAPALVDDEVVEAIREQIPLAPLHNPANLLGIEVARAAFPAVPQVAVFDTAFHKTMPPRAYRYALPRELADRLRIRRYGFHGT